MNQGDVFQAYRSLLFSIACRMLGSVMDAEDGAQEAYLRWHQAFENGEVVQSPKTYEIDFDPSVLEYLSHHSKIRCASRL